MRYYANMSQSLNDRASSQKRMEEWKEATMQEEQPHKRSCAQDFGNQQYIRMQKRTIGMRCLPKDGETIVEGGIAFEPTNHFVGI